MDVSFTSVDVVAEFLTIHIIFILHLSDVYIRSRSHQLCQLNWMVSWCALNSMHAEVDSNYNPTSDQQSYIEIVFEYAAM